MARIASSSSREVSGEKLKVALLSWNREASYPPSVKLASPVLLAKLILVILRSWYVHKSFHRGLCHRKEHVCRLTLRSIICTGSISPRETWNTSSCLQTLYQRRYGIIEGCQVSRCSSQSKGSGEEIFSGNANYNLAVHFRFVWSGHAKVDRVERKLAILVYT